MEISAFVVMALNCWDKHIRWSNSQGSHHVNQAFSLPQFATEKINKQKIEMKRKDETKNKQT